MIIPLWFFPVVAVFWVFILWMGWKIVQALKDIDADLKEIARGLNQRQE